MPELLYLPSTSHFQALLLCCYAYLKLNNSFLPSSPFHPHQLGVLPRKKSNSLIGSFKCSTISEWQVALNLSPASERKRLLVSALQSPGTCQITRRDVCVLMGLLETSLELLYQKIFLGFSNGSRLCSQYKYKVKCEV